MSQKSSVPQAASFVSWALKRALHLPYLFSAITQRRGFGSFHRQAQGALTAPAQAERFRGSREGTFHRILRS
jgi:hypothetical protein